MTFSTPASRLQPLPLLLSVAGSLAGAGVLLASLPARAQGLNNMRDQLIIHYCTLAVNEIGRAHV